MMAGKSFMRMTEKNVEDDISAPLKIKKKDKILF
jgi:hypothetical protein